MTTKTKSTQRLISLLTAVLLTAGLLCAAIIPASASEADVRATADGILHFGKLYNDVYLGSGSCFLINEDTIITANHCARFSQLEYDYLKEQYGWTKKEIDSGFSDNDKGQGFTYEVTLARDFTIEATLVNSSENMDFAILKLSQPIQNRSYLTLRDSTTVEAAETAYAVGFPGAKDSESITYQYYNQKDIAFESGTINRKQYTDTYTLADSGAVFSGEVLMLSAGTISAGNSGGPMIDTNGNVIGICSAASTGTCYASAISQVMEILDALGVPYHKYDGSKDDDDSKKTEAVASQSETTAEAETEAVVAVAAEPATQAATETAAGTETQGTGMTLLIIIIAAVVVLIIAAVVILLIVMSKKKNSAPTQSFGSVPPTRPVDPGNYNAGETTMLRSDVGETTVLGGGSEGFMLVRKSNNDRVMIRKPEYIIGKDKTKADYCITDNTSVSRTHAKIRVRSGKCYITDLGSTNCTYVNGITLAPNQEKELISGDRIKLADVEFTFYG
ncbi:MAG: trypsin-like peptidase domain-containing protein [Ruminococcus sp.]|nr:trypsin-like peptidase domain-containing protein [Ruminococcus sp.]